MDHPLLPQLGTYSDYPHVRISKNVKKYHLQQLLGILNAVVRDETIPEKTIHMLISGRCTSTRLTNFSFYRIRNFNLGTKIYP